MTATLRIRDPYVLGLDLGQAQDPTALAIIERAPGATVTDPVTHLARHLQRWPLWTPYPQVVADVRDLLDRSPLRGETAALVVDATGVGAAVVDLFKGARLGTRLVPVAITAGAEAHEADLGWRVPKRDLVGVAQVLLQRRRLRIAQGLADAEVLIQELQSFRVTITAAGRDSYGAAAEAHDDLVIALALAAWWGEMMVRPVVEEEDDEPFNAWSREALLAEMDRGRRSKRHLPTRQYPPEAVT